MAARPAVQTLARQAATGAAGSRPRKRHRTTVLAVIGLAAIALTGCADPEDDVVLAPAGPGAESTESPSPSDSPTPEPTIPPTEPTTEGGPSPTTPGPSASAPVSADLTITIDNGYGTISTYRLTCEPSGGDVPDPDAACTALTAAWPAAFSPVPKNVMCTMQYGGPQTATVTGTVNGQQMSAQFNRTNGCEISRWATVAALAGTAASGDV